MALPALKDTVDRSDAPAASAVALPQPAWPSSAGAPAGASFVRDMQRDLESRLAEPQPGKWSNRRTLVFVVGTCGLFWGAVTAAILAL